MSSESWYFSVCFLLVSVKLSARLSSHYSYRYQRLSTRLWCFSFRIIRSLLSQRWALEQAISATIIVDTGETLELERMEVQVFRLMLFVVFLFFIEEVQSRYFIDPCLYSLPSGDSQNHPDWPTLSWMVDKSRWADGDNRLIWALAKKIIVPKSKLSTSLFCKHGFVLQFENWYNTMKKPYSKWREHFFECYKTLSLLSFIVSS